MYAVRLFLGIGWAAFWLYWFAAATRVKHGHVPWGPVVRVRLAVFVLAIGLARIGAFRARSAPPGGIRVGVGLALFVAGLVSAVWARLHLGRNWGNPMTQKDEPELVTSGPYRYVRHPIYSAILLAGIGTAMALSWMWLIVVAVAGIYFGYSSVVEERFFTQQFPEAYPQYQRSTKRMVPFLY